MKIKLIAALMSLVLGFAGTALAVSGGSPEEAKDMAVRAAGYLEQNGTDAAVSAFMSDSAEWHDRDLYVFVIDNDGTMVAHGAKEALVGRNLLALKDVDGKPFVEEVLKVQGADWVEDKGQNPQTNTVEKKTSYIVRVGEMVVGVGAYAR